MQYDVSAGCGMAGARNVERLQGPIQFRVAAKANAREFRCSPLKAQSQINRTAYEPPHVLRYVRRLVRRDAGGH